VEWVTTVEHFVCLLTDFIIFFLLWMKEHVNLSIKMLLLANS